MNIAITHLDETGVTLLAGGVEFYLCIMKASKVLSTKDTATISITMEGDKKIRKLYQFNWQDFVEFIKSQAPGADTYFERIDSFTGEQP